MTKNDPTGSQKTKPNQPNRITIVLIASLFVIVGAALAVYAVQNGAKKVDTFQACKDAGGAIQESYPETCSYKGTSFVNETQSLANPDSYVGLSETDALNQAERGNKQARVVERDGESLPVDASFMQGRLNLYVKDGKVFKVTVEGQ